MHFAPVAKMKESRNSVQLHFAHKENHSSWIWEYEADAFSKYTYRELNSSVLISLDREFIPRVDVIDY